MKSLYLCESPDNVDYVYGAGQKSRLASLTENDGRVCRLSDLAGGSDAEVIFSTWGMPRVEEADIPRLFPKLKAVFYAAGSVQAFAEPFLRSGVAVFSAWQANAVPVAQYTLAQITLAVKGYFTAQRLFRTSRKQAQEAVRHYPGLYEIRVGLLGLGGVGSAVAKLLRPYGFEVLGCDPYVSDERMAELGVRRASMEEIFASCDVVSNHLPNLPATRGIIRREHLFSMKEYATFINTGRGPQLDEGDLYELLTQRDDLTALLDVLTDEADADNNPLNRLPNCLITPHIAGSMGNEVHRMAEYMLDEFERWRDGRETPFRVTLNMLETMA